MMTALTKQWLSGAESRLRRRLVKTSHEEPNDFLFIVSVAPSLSVRQRNAANEVRAPYNPEATVAKSQKCKCQVRRYLLLPG